jgi:GNAT superfamily N-acetyltransferase
VVYHYNPKAMASILHFRKELMRPPVALEVADIRVRSMIVPDDVDAWLELRSRATAGMLPRVREWTRDDFSDQMVQKPWWRHDRTWLAMDAMQKNSPAVGAVTLALRTGTAITLPIVHWLLVDPAWRRRGVGRILISQLECAAWSDGWRQIELETHAGWKEAAAFYHSMGYAPVRERSPR